MEESFLLTVATNLGFCLSSLKSSSTECSLSFWVATFATKKRRRLLTASYWNIDKRDNNK